MERMTCFLLVRLHYVHVHFISLTESKLGKKEVAYFYYFMCLLCQEVNEKLLSL